MKFKGHGCVCVGGGELWLCPNYDDNSINLYPALQCQLFQITPLIIAYVWYNNILKNIVENEHNIMLIK